MQHEIFAPPYGTASRARKIRRHAGPSPKLLRSDDFPDGLPDLGSTDAERGRQANLLYEFVATACTQLTERGICWTVENLGNSLMWKTSFFQRALPLLQRSPAFPHVYAWRKAQQAGSTLGVRHSGGQFARHV